MKVKAVGEIDGASTARATEASFVQHITRILRTIPTIFLFLRVVCFIAYARLDFDSACPLDDELAMMIQTTKRGQLQASFGNHWLICIGRQTRHTPPVHKSKTIYYKVKNEMLLSAVR